MKRFVPLQQKLTSQILNEYLNPDDGYYYIPLLDHKYLGFLLEENKDFDSIRESEYNVFRSPLTYDAFRRDYAMVQIIFQKSIAVQMSSQLRMTWIDYFSSVCLLFGLVLGMGFVSVFELIWLAIRIFSSGVV
jgi:hypothetical protein